MKRNLLSALSFLLILVLLLTALGMLFVPKGNRVEDGIQEEELYAFLAEPENSLDVVVLGDSIPLCSVIPVYLWRDYGITGFVCASTAQRVSQSAQILGKFLSRQSPKVVLLETDQLYLDMTAAELLADGAQSIFPVLQYHDSWKFVRPNRMLRQESFTYTSPQKGYHLRKTVESLETDPVFTPVDEVEAVLLLSRTVAGQIKRLCDRSGAQLVLYTAPNAATWNMARHNGSAALAQKLGIPYLDANLEETGIIWLYDTLDSGEHLNNMGAAKVTAWLGAYLSDSGMLTDHRNDPAYSAWDSALEEFENRVNDPENYF